jgi:hypothetical protein
MFMAGLRFTIPPAAEPDPPHLVGSFRVVEVDLFSMCENICAEGDGAQLSPWWRDATARMKVRSPYSTPFPPLFLL